MLIARVVVCTSLLCGAVASVAETQSSTSVAPTPVPPDVRVEVVAPDGRPVAASATACVGAAGGGCARVRCTADGFLPGEAPVEQEGARCRLRPALSISGTVLAGCGAGCEARLSRAASAEAIVARSAIADTAGDGVLRFRLPAVAPGRYLLELADAAGWACRAELGPLGAGPFETRVPWRAPVTVRGVARAEGGRPAGGVPIELRVSRASERDPFGTWRCAAKEPPRATSAAEGTFSVSGVDPGADQLLIGGTWDGPLGVGVLALDAPLGAVPLSLKLERPVRVMARLLDDAQKPLRCRAKLLGLDPLTPRLARALPGALLESACADDGRVTLGPLPAAALDALLLPESAPPQRIARPRPRPGSTLDLGDVIVPRGATIEVVATDAAGTPVAKAEARAFPSGGFAFRATGVTGDDGKATLTGVPKNAPFDLWVVGQGFVPAHFAARRVAESPFAVTLDPAARLAGRVVDEDGNPVAGAGIAVRGAGVQGESAATTADDGTFAIDEARPGKATLAVRIAGYLAPQPLVLDLVAGVERSVPDIVLKTAPVRRGRVVDELARAVADARVWAGASFEPDSAHAGAVTDAEGRFTLPRGDAGEGLFAIAPGYGAALVEPLPADGTEVVVTLPREARARVRVPAGLPPAAQAVILDGAGVRHRLPAASGAVLEFAGLAPGDGKAWLEYTRSAFPAVTQDLDLQPGVTVDVVLDRSTSLDGAVSVDGAPAASALVAAVTWDGNQLGDAVITLADPQGAFRFEALSPGKKRVVALAGGARVETDIDLPPGSAGSVTLSGRRIAVEALVRDDVSGDPVPGALVTFVPGTAARDCYSSGSGGWNAATGLTYDVQYSPTGCVNASTNDTGLAQLALAAPGPYQVLIEARGYTAARDAIALQPGTTPMVFALMKAGAEKKSGTTRVEISLDVPPGSRAGVACDNGEVRWRRWMQAGAEPISCELPQGAATVTASVLGFGSVVQPITVDGTAKQTVRLAVARGGTLLVPVQDPKGPRPEVRDDAMVEWGAVLERTRVSLGFAPKVVNVAGGGPAWQFDDLPPGTYRVVVDGATSPPVTVVAGQTVTAP